MDENNNYENHEHHHHHDCWLCDHPVFKHIITALMVFLGAYLAFYTVTDWHFKRMLDPAMQMRRIERKMLHEQKQIENMYKRNMERGMHLEEQTAGYIRAEKRPDAYEIIVNLRPFDNSDKNVEVRTDGETHTVIAAGEKETRNHEKVIKVIQQFTFNDDVDLSSITKTRRGSNYIITVPIIQ